MPWKSLILWSWYWQRPVIQSICLVREWKFFTENLKKLMTTVVHSQSYKGFAKFISNSLHLHSRIAGTVVKVTRIKYRALCIWRPVVVISPTWRTNLYIILQDDENIRIIFGSKTKLSTTLARWSNTECQQLLPYINSAKQQEFQSNCF